VLERRAGDMGTGHSHTPSKARTQRRREDHMVEGFAQHRCLKAAIVAAAAACTVAMAGCGTAAPSDGPSHKVIVVRDGANGETVSVGVGDTLKLILASSYWNVAGSSMPRVLRQDGPAVLLARPKSCPDIAGLGCTPVRILFTALTRGMAVIRASRTTCGEALKCVGKNATRFTLNVVVTKST
jgi:hypothetical protein